MESGQFNDLSTFSNHVNLRNLPQRCKLSRWNLLEHFYSSKNITSEKSSVTSCLHLLAVAISTIAVGKRADKNNRGRLYERFLKYAHGGIVWASKATCRTHPSPALCLLSSACA